MVATPAKKWGRKSDSSPSAGPAISMRVAKPIRIEFAQRRREYEVRRPAGCKPGTIRVQVSGIAVEIFVRGKLRRIDENADDDPFRAVSCVCHQREMARMERPHGGNKGDPLAGAPPGGQPRPQFGDRCNEGRRCHAGRLAAAPAGTLETIADSTYLQPMKPDPLRKAISQAWLADEEKLSDELIARARLSSGERSAIEALATDLVGRIRQARDRRSAVDAFTQEYALSSEEGVVLMCLAESLLRVPDAATADRLIRDKIGSGDWGSHLNRIALCVRQRVHLGADAERTRGNAG